MRIILLVGCALLSVLSSVQSSNAQTAEETVAYMLYGLEAVGNTKLTSTKPATFEANGTSPSGPVSARMTMTALDQCNYAFTEEDETPVNGVRIVMKIHQEFDLSGVSSISLRPKGNEMHRTLDGLKISKCSITLIPLGQLKPEQASEIARENEADKNVSPSKCQDLQRDGFVMAPAYKMDRAQAALSYFKSNFCKGRAF